MKKDLIKFIVVGTYNKKEQHVLSIEKFTEIVGKEKVDRFLAGYSKTDVEKLSYEELKQSLRVRSEVEDLLRQSLNYKSSQMLFGFMK